MDTEAVRTAAIQGAIFLPGWAWDTGAPEGPSAATGAPNSHTLARSVDPDLSH
jgi:hypothetical protein